MCCDCTWAPSQSRLSAVPALPKGEPRGGRSPPSAEGKTVRTRRRSRPWLPLWGSWRAISEPERAWAVASLRIGALIAVGYPLSHDHHLPSNRVTPCGVGQLPGLQTRIASGCIPALSVTAFSRASSPKGRAKGRLRRPAQRVRRCEPGGVAALGSPRWGSWRAISEPERAWAVANMGKCGDCCRVPSQSRLAPCQLSQRESQGAASPPSAEGNTAGIRRWSCSGDPHCVFSLHCKMSGQRKQPFLPANTKSGKMKRIIAYLANFLTEREN